MWPCRLTRSTGACRRPSSASSAIQVPAETGKRCVTQGRRLQCMCSEGPTLSLSLSQNSSASAICCRVNPALSSGSDIAPPGTAGSDLFFPRSLRRLFCLSSLPQPARRGHFRFHRRVACPREPSPAAACRRRSCTLQRCCLTLTEVDDVRRRASGRGILLLTRITQSEIQSTWAHHRISTGIRFGLGWSQMSRQVVSAGPRLSRLAITVGRRPPHAARNSERHVHGC